MKTQLWAIGVVILAGLIGGFAPIYLKKATNMIKVDNLRTIYKNNFLIIGILLYGMATILVIPALKYGELSVIYPLIGLSYAWMCIYSIFILKEKMTLLKWVGISLIITGVGFIGLGA